jgi:uncharacterized damage-inducible protein DinB
MNADYFRTMFDYHYWAHRKVWGCVMQLDEELYRRPCDYSVGSVHEQVVHTFGAERLWLHRVLQQPTVPFAAPDDFADRSVLRAAWDAQESEWRAIAAGLEDTRLAQVIEYTSIHGNMRRESPLWLMMAQVLNHGTDHRAQILALLHQLGGPTVEQDLIIYSWE